ncbi:MAG TPA: SIMPL domain-containing protein [Pirellulales bacterium]|nr:SIMPL domain-containing protein [Pirellulales bacterium]
MSNPLAAEDRAITVTGAGKALAKPDLMELELHAAGEAELMADATTKYEGAVRRITGAVSKLEIAGLKIEPRGIRISDQAADDDEERIVFMPGGGGRQGAAKAHTGISRSLRVVVPKIDHKSETEVIATIAKLLDAAKDAGAAVGPPRRSNAYEYIVTADGDTVQPGQGVVTFVVSDPAAAREEAYRKAFADAMRRAERVAKLAGARVGGVLSADETDSAQMVIYSGRGANVAEDRLVSNVLEDIPVRVLLQVRFALESNVDQPRAKAAVQK